MSAVSLLLWSSAPKWAAGHAHIDTLDLPWAQRLDDDREGLLGMDDVLSAARHGDVASAERWLADLREQWHADLRELEQWMSGEGPLPKVVGREQIGATTLVLVRGRDDVLEGTYGLLVPLACSGALHAAGVCIRDFGYLDVVVHQGSWTWTRMPSA